MEATLHTEVRVTWLTLIRIYENLPTSCFRVYKQALTKLSKLATELGVATIHELGYASKVAFQEEKLQVLRTHP